MSWTPEQIEKHKKAANLLYKIIEESFDLISKNKNITEFEVQQFIKKRFEHYGMRSDQDDPIVAFRENTGLVHYFPKKKSKKLETDSLILIDIWAKLKDKNSPYADITWMGYYGKDIPKEILEVFKKVLEARDKSIKYIQDNLKKGILVEGGTVHEKSDKIIIEAGFKSDHFIGHSIGLQSPHGAEKDLQPKKSASLRINLGYTIEPGIYLKNKFGSRSEIDFYIDDKKNLHITTEVQKKIILIKPI